MYRTYVWAHQRYKVCCICLRFETSSNSPWPTLVYACRQDKLINVYLFSRRHQLCALESYAKGEQRIPQKVDYIFNPVIGRRITKVFQSQTTGTLY